MKVNEHSQIAVWEIKGETGGEINKKPGIW